MLQQATPGINPNGANGNPYHARFHDLLDRHYQVLARGSGIADDVIGERGYRSVSGGSELRPLGFTSAQRSHVPGILVPMFASDGSDAGCQYRPDSPRFDPITGRPVKYETPAGAEVRLDIPARCRASIADASIPLWITEGCKKADALATHGLCAIALAGVWMFRTKASNDTRTLHADFDAVALTDRAVYIVYDSDIMTKPPVMKALNSLIGHLRRKHAVPETVYLPAADDGSKVGVDDYLLTHSVDELKTLVGQPKPAAMAQPATPTATATATTMGTACPFIPGTDLAAADFFASLQGADLRHVGAWRKWLIFDGSRWLADETGEIWRRARTMPPAVAKVSDWSEQLSGRSKLSAMVGLAESDARIAISHESLDRDQMLLNTASGTIDLRTGDLRPAERADLLTKISPIAYDPAATCPQFDRFLEEILPDPEVREYMQRWFGYCLTGSTREQRVAFWYGKGANGKTVLSDLLLHLLGEYGSVAPKGFLDQKPGGDDHPTEIADLFQRRLITCAETEQDAKMAESALKQQVGSGRMKGRRMREDFWEFDPTHKVVIFGNHRPAIRGTDDGIWRRLDLVPFTVRIPEERWDRLLTEKLKAEAAGILAWAIRGCLDWQKHGLPRPQAVKAATAAYRADSDQLGAFLRDCCELKPDAEVSASELRAAYEAWAKESGIKDRGMLGNTAWGGGLTERGCERGWSLRHVGQKRLRVWIGIRLLDAPEQGRLGLDAKTETGTDGTDRTLIPRLSQISNGVASGIYSNPETGVPSVPSVPSANPTDPQEQTSNKADSTEETKQATTPVSIYSKSSTIHNVEATREGNQSVSQETECLLYCSELPLSLGDLVNLVDGSGVLQSAEPLLVLEIREHTDGARFCRFDHPETGAPFWWPEATCELVQRDLSPAILDLARGRGWQLLVVDYAGGQLVPGGSEERWRRWVDEHANGERAAVLVALKSEVENDSQHSPPL